MGYNKPVKAITVLVDGFSDAQPVLRRSLGGIDQGIKPQHLHRVCDGTTGNQGSHGVFDHARTRCESVGGLGHANRATGMDQ